ncbi:MAG: dicarboxylate/amino acid:cation symporter [Candidatus Palauibacterales bacterium]|nr:dicarboxylate/amino acid:cation symporter [Candidatus Palauibacterales bacterium]MDP2528195.1 dicarboxylate/amino acid:cation symporter [Candidatus Palauibacterales bacterium]MDP2584855.1 dicarboxylate/amino acid:cation symporter [Candidatus Palauibacterales bacterium]
MKLHTKITLALILGAVAGVAAHLLASATGQTWLRDALVWIEPIGNAWIRLITMVVVPLVMASLIVGTASLGDITKLGRIGGKTVAYYLCTTAVAVSIGLLLSNLLAPGSHMDPTALQNLRSTYIAEGASRVRMAQQTPGLKDVILDMIPRNPIQAMASGDMLPIIFFSIFFGAAVSVLPGERRDGVIKFVDGVNEAAMVMVHWIMELAPYAVFALIGAVLARFGADVLKSLLVYSVTVLLGLALHVGITYPAALRFLARVSPVDFFRRVREVPLIAFSTSSSNATLPVTMETAEEEVGVSPEVSSFVLPLGATINMDGTALYQAVATMFIAQVLVGHLSLAAQLGIVATATLASIGAAGVPSAGIIILIVVLKQALPASVDPAAGIALILGVDRILDMCRTAVNVTGDLTAATVVARSEGETLKVRSGGRRARPAA